MKKKFKSGETEKASVFKDSCGFYVRHIYWRKVESGETLRHTSFYPMNDEFTAQIIVDALKKTIK